MVFRKLFGGSNEGESGREYTIDELIILERYDDAELKIKHKMKTKDELHDHIKLAEVYTQQRKIEAAVGEYVYVADMFTRDGFYDKAGALLQRAARLAPLDETIPQRLGRIEELKRLEKSRSHALDGLRERQAEGEGPKLSVVEFQTIWNRLAKTRMIKSLGTDHVRALFGAVEVVYRDVGEILVEAGSIREELFILARGEVEAVGPPEVGSLRKFGTGQVLGESQLFEKRPAPATIRAISSLTAMRLDRAGLQRCLTGNPDPRSFLSALRDQGNDRDLANILHKLGR